MNISEIVSVLEALAKYATGRNGAVRRNDTSAKEELSEEETL